MQQEIWKVCAILDEKRELFKEFERETMEIITGSAETLSVHMENRMVLQKKIDDVSGRLLACSSGNGDLANAAGLRCDRGALPEDCRVIFDHALALRAVIERIRAVESQTMERFVAERDFAEQKIRELNQGNEAAAAKYFQSTKPSGSGTVLGKA